MMTAGDFKDALTSLGLDREDLARILGYTWGSIDNWYRGKISVPKAVEILLILWMHPACPAEFKPAPGSVYQLVVPDGYFKKAISSAH